MQMEVFVALFGTLVVVPGIPVYIIVAACQSRV